MRLSTIFCALLSAFCTVFVFADAWWMLDQYRHPTLGWDTMSYVTLLYLMCISAFCAITFGHCTVLRLKQDNRLRTLERLTRQVRSMVAFCLLSLLCSCQIRTDVLVSPLTPEGAKGYRIFVKIPADITRVTSVGDTVLINDVPMVFEKLGEEHRYWAWQ